MTRTAVSIRLAGVGVGVATVVATSGCGLTHLSQLKFTRDNSLTIEQPQARALVKVPLTIRWQSASPSPSYGVFIDRTPIRVGQSLHRGDLPPDTYLTSKRSLKISVLPAASNGHGDEQHEVTIVRLDATGTRRTESSWYVDFRFPRRSAT